MARPSKTVEILEKEKKSHRTKAELELRKAAEQAALTGIKIKPDNDVKNDTVAMAEYKRIVRILSKVGKNDALYESVINEYAMLKADIERYRVMKAQVEESDLPIKEKCEMTLRLDAQIDKYKKRRFDIEKENGMTIASAMRAIPKKPEQKSNPLLEALRDD